MFQEVGGGKAYWRRPFQWSYFWKTPLSSALKCKKNFRQIGVKSWKVLQGVGFTENKHRNRYFSKLFYEISRKFLGNLDSKNRFMVVVWGSIFSYSFLYILECVSTFWRVWGEHQVAGLHTIDKLQYQPKYFAQSKEIQ